METSYLISIEEICTTHEIDVSFIDLLTEYGFIEVKREGNSVFIAADQVDIVERCIHLHFDLEINMEGIETITHLLQRITLLQHEITDLKNRLRLYESDIDTL